MSGVVNVNGRISDAQQATVSVFDHGFLYGEGVYETLRTYNRRPFLFDRHMRRLRRSAAMIDLTLPLSDAACLDRINETMTAAAATDEAYIRILLTRGVGELTYDPAACPEPSLIIIVKAHQPTPSELLARGVTVALVSIVRNHPGTVNPRIKSNNLLNNALAMQEAVKQNAYEALMRNYLGDLAECSSRTSSSCGRAPCSRRRSTPACWKASPATSSSRSAHTLAYRCGRQPCATPTWIWPTRRSSPARPGRSCRS